MSTSPCITIIFFFNDTATTEIYTLSLHDALPICADRPGHRSEDPLHRQGKREDLAGPQAEIPGSLLEARSEEHTSELQSRFDLVCRLLLEKKKKQYLYHNEAP